MYKAIQDLSTGDTFKKKLGTKKTFVRGSYCRINKAYECTAYDDINEFIYLKKDKIVYENN